MLGSPHCNLDELSSPWVQHLVDTERLDAGAAGAQVWKTLQITVPIRTTCFHVQHSLEIAITKLIIINQSHYIYNYVHVTHLRLVIFQILQILTAHLLAAMHPLNGIHDFSHQHVGQTGGFAQTSSCLARIHVDRFLFLPLGRWGGNNVSLFAFLQHAFMSTWSFGGGQRLYLHFREFSCKYFISTLSHALRSCLTHTAS